MTSGRVTGGVLAVLGLGVGLEASTFSVGFMTDPVGPRALPLVAAALLVVTGVHLLVRPGEGIQWPPRDTLLRLGKAALALGLYGLLLQPLGFVVATVLVVTALGLLFGGELKPTLGAATVLSAALWYLFVWALGLPLPLGAIWTAVAELPWMP